MPRVGVDAQLAPSSSASSPPPSRPPSFREVPAELRPGKGCGPPRDPWERVLFPRLGNSRLLGKGVSWAQQGGAGKRLGQWFLPAAVSASCPMDLPAQPLFTAAGWVRENRQSGSPSWIWAWGHPGAQTATLGSRSALALGKGAAVGEAGGGPNLMDRSFCCGWSSLQSRLWGVPMPDAHCRDTLAGEL